MDIFANALIIVVSLGIMQKHNVCAFDYIALSLMVTLSFYILFMVSLKAATYKTIPKITFSTFVQVLWPIFLLIAWVVTGHNVQWISDKIQIF